MRFADKVLEDEQLLTTVYEALTKRRPKSRTRGRLGTPAEVVLRLLLLKHIRNWSYEVVEREVRANLVYREFTRVGGGKVPDDTVMNKWALALGPEVIETIHKRVVAIAQENKIIQGRQMRVDTTVVETNIHYPTDSSLMGDGVRVLTRVMKRITTIAGDGGAKLRDRTRSVKLRMLEIGRAAREAAAGIRKAAGCSLASGGPGEAFLARDYGWSEKVLRCSQASRHRGTAKRTGHDGAESAAGDAASPRASLRRRHTRGKQVGQRLRADDRGHPQGQGEQAHRVRQDGEDPGSGESDHHRV